MTDFSIYRLLVSVLTDRVAEKLVFFRVITSKRSRMCSIGLHEEHQIGKESEDGSEIGTTLDYAL